VRFNEIDLFGVYPAPISVIMIAVWPVVLLLRRVAHPFDPLRLAWRPSLFPVAVHVIVTSPTLAAFAR
jgi:protein AaeX